MYVCTRIISMHSFAGVYEVLSVGQHQVESGSSPSPPLLDHRPAHISCVYQVRVNVVGCYKQSVPFECCNPGVDGGQHFR